VCEMADYKPISTPMVVGQRLSAGGTSFSDPTLYRSIVGALQYLVITHPDLAHGVNNVCQFMHAPTEDHYHIVKRILQYVKGALTFSLNISSHSFSNILAYLDADWAGCPDTRCPTSGYAVFLDNNLISWSTKKQSTVSRSSAQSEYRTLALTVAEVTWLTHLLCDLRVSSPTPATILCDNHSAIFMSANLMSHARSKHIALDTTLFGKKLMWVPYMFSLFLHSYRLLISSPRVSLALSFPFFGPSSPSLLHP
jgi:hypothetical protein